ncbi:MAG: endonuclease, partial [Planctomycetota bacterium]
MTRIRFFVVFSLCLIVPGTGAIAEDILLGQRGSVLRDNLRRQYTPTDSQSYDAAREAMFSNIDNVDGEVTCVYTGVKYRTAHIPNHEIVNTEHTWPQSKFEDGSNSAQMKADLHHLYVTLNEVNAIRGNFPLAEIPDSETRRWWISADGQRNLPSSHIDDYSESIPGAFEPREVHK